MAASPSPPRKPIRIGIVGLSATPFTWGQLAHAPYLLASPYYKIVALCNSSISAGQAAVKHYNLDPEITHCYASYSTIATDPNIDILIITTRADTHHAAALPSLAYAPHTSLKAIYCEWPLAANTTDAREMHSLATEHNIRTVVGLQGRTSPTVQLIKSFLNSNRLGTLHSANFHGAINVWQNNAAGSKYHYFMDRAVGGNLLTIYGGHCLDSLLYALSAELQPGAYAPLLGNLRPGMWHSDANGKVLEGEGLYSKDTPDQIMLQGRLDVQGYEGKPAPLLSFHLRAGNRFSPESPGSTWRIYGTKGELVVDFASAGPQIGQATSIKFSNMETGQIEDLLAEVEQGGERWTGLPTQGQNIGRLFEGFARDWLGERAEGEERVHADWEVAVRRHELLDEFWESGM